MKLNRDVERVSDACNELIRTIKDLSKIYPSILPDDMLLTASSHVTSAQRTSGNTRKQRDGQAGMSSLRQARVLFISTIDAGWG